MMDTRQIVRRALITEKGSVLREAANQVTFEVHPDANKIEIKRAVESIFKVKVVTVRTQNMHGKVKRLGRSVGRRPDWKRAIVTLAKDQTIELFDRMGRRDDGANSCLAFGNCGVPDTRRKQPLVEQLPRKLKRRLRLSDHNRSDRRLALPGTEPGISQSTLIMACVPPQVLHPFRLLLEHIERSQARSGDRRRMRCREQKWPCPVI